MYVSPMGDISFFLETNNSHPKNDAILCASTPNDTFLCVHKMACGDESVEILEDFFDEYIAKGAILISRDVMAEAKAYRVMREEEMIMNLIINTDFDEEMQHCNCRL